MFGIVDVIIYRCYFIVTSGGSYPYLHHFLLLRIWRNLEVIVSEFLLKLNGQLHTDQKMRYLFEGFFLK